MKRVLLDENIDQALKELFDNDFQVATFTDQGWQGKQNGELLCLTAAEFDVFVTMDKNLQYQQTSSPWRLLMRVSDFKTLYTYNSWARDKVLSAAGQLPLDSVLEPSEVGGCIYNRISSRGRKRGPLDATKSRSRLFSCGRNVCAAIVFSGPRGARSTPATVSPTTNAVP